MKTDWFDYALIILFGAIVAGLAVRLFLSTSGLGG